MGLTGKSLISLGIVGHAAEKFVGLTEACAWRAIQDAIDIYDPYRLVSGRSPMGGVDIWAEEIAKAKNISMLVHAPRKGATWASPGGFKERNLRIARDSDLVVVVVVASYPSRFRGMRFGECYHCARHPRGCKVPHVKSGGCWTALKAKRAQWRIITLSEQNAADYVVVPT